MAEKNKEEIETTACEAENPAEAVETESQEITVSKDEFDALQAEREAGNLSSYVEPVMNFAAEIMSAGTSGDMFVGGASKILSHPEYRDPDKARRLLDYLSSDQRDMVHSIKFDDEAGDSSGSMHITIGRENLAEPLQDASVIYRTYGVGRHLRGVIGVVGPTRMDYARVAANLNYFVEGLNKLLKTAFLEDNNEDI